MNIIIITQNDPFYLGKSIDYLLNQLNNDLFNVIGILILPMSPFGRPESFFKRTLRTYKVFGGKFFLRYTLKYIFYNFIYRQFLIKNIIKKHNLYEIKLLNLDINGDEFYHLLRRLSPDIILSISCNQIFKKRLLALPRYGCLNLHTAKLPYYRGLMPTFWAMKNGEKEIGVSVFFIDEGIDTGDIIVQKIVPIADEDTLETLIEKTKKIGMEAIVEALNLIHRGEYKTIRFHPSEGSYYSFPTRKDVQEFLRRGNKFW